DPARSRFLGRERRLDRLADQRLPGPARRARAARRRRRRSLRTKAHVPRRPRRLHRRLAGLRPCARIRLAARGARSARRRRSFVGITVLTLCLYAALSGMVVLLPYLLIRSAGWSAAGAGAALLPLSVAMGLGSRAAGHLAERVGARLLLTVGPLIVAAGFAL